MTTAESLLAAIEGVESYISKNIRGGPDRALALACCARARRGARDLVTERLDLEDRMARLAGQVPPERR